MPHTHDFPSAGSLSRDAARGLCVDERMSTVVDVQTQSWLTAAGPETIRLLTPAHPFDVWAEFPAQIAVLVHPPQPDLTRAAALASETASVPELWRSMAEAVSAGMPVESRPIDLRPQEFPELAPAPPGPELAWIMGAVKRLRNPFPGGTREQAIAWTALQAGLLQIHDELDASHECSQSIEGLGACRTGDYWHGIMHRREPDYGNSGYWFRRVGQHPVFDELAALAPHVLSESGCEHPAAASVVRSGKWSSSDMIDLCRIAAGSADPGLVRSAEELQWLEMLLLLRHTWRELRGSS